MSERMDAPMSEGMDEWRARYRYDEWAGRSRLDESLLVWRFFLVGDELEGWRSVKQNVVAFDEGLSMQQSIWQPMASSDTVNVEGPLLRLDVFECDSLRAAHELSVRLLTEFEGPVIRFDEETGVGDVSFAGPDDSVLLFARGNMVVILRNAGRQVVPVREHANVFDLHLTRKPEADGRVAPQIRRFARASGYEEPSGGPLEIDVVDPLDRRVWLKLFASGGELLLEGQKALFRPSPSGAARVTVYAINENRGAASATLDLRSA